MTTHNAAIREVFRNGFDKHLDECRRCRDRPFDLCPVGSLLLHVAVTTSIGQPRLDPRRP